MDSEERKNSGISAIEEKLIANPYIIWESDLCSATSDPVSLDTIDRGMHSLMHFSQGQLDLIAIQQGDIRRVRA